MENHKLTKCPNCVGAFSGITIDGKKIVAGPLRCNSWACEFCQPILIKKLYRRILQGSIGQDATPRYGLKFLTLTFAGQEERQRVQDMIENHNRNLLKKPDRDKLKESDQVEPAPEDQKIWSYPEIVYDIMTESFHKLIRALKKQYGNFHYFRVNELQKDGTPHFHVLLAGNAVIPKDILDSIEDKWVGIYGMGFVRINCIKFRDKKHAVRYMLKYITKDIKKPGKRKRIFTASRHALLKVDKPNWLAVEVYIGKVNDNGIHEEKVSFDNDLGHGYCGLFDQDSVRIIPKKDVLKVVLQRHLKNLLQYKTHYSQADYEQEGIA